MKRASWLLPAILAVACDGGPRPEGLWEALRDQGPTVVFDLDAKPLPDVPFPIDIATRFDPTSATSRRVNVAIAPGTTDLERDLRRKADALNGFATYAPIWVRFDRDLDLCKIRQRHHDNDRFDDDTIYLVNVTPGSPDYGEPMLLDLGRGNFPLALPRTDNYFENDPRSSGDNLVFETHDEDKNGDGILQPEEDTDSDGVLDHATVLPSCPGPWRYDRPTFYESESHTLLLRPILPLLPKTTYAVVLTRRLVGLDGKPVRSPFQWVNHARQTEALKALADKSFVTSLGLAWDDARQMSPDVAFVWSFTTQAIEDDLVAIRKGMAGGGTLGWLKDRYPPKLQPTQLLDRPVRVDEKRWEVYTLPGKWFIDKLGQVLADALGGGSSPGVALLLDGMRENVDYFVAGAVTSPNFLVDRNDQYTGPDNPGDDDEIFDIDLGSGRAVVDETTVGFWCSVPKRRPGIAPPFPVVFYAHGYTSTMLEMLGFAAQTARLGLAQCSANAFGHGLSISPKDRELIDLIIKDVPVRKTIEMLEPGRARDLDNDGEVDSGGDFWTADFFHTRDVLRQTIVDYMSIIRGMREFNGATTWHELNGSDVPGLAGDWDGDGQVDLGGPDSAYYAWGQSLGGFVSSLLGAVEPAVAAAAPVSGGGGLVDVGARSVQGGVVEAVFLRVMGPLVVGRPNPAGGVDLVMLVPNLNRLPDPELVFARNVPVAQGDRVTLRNTRNGEERHAVAGGDGRFRLGVAADAVGAVEKRKRLGLTPGPDHAQWIRVDDTAALGDQLVVEVRGASGLPKYTVETFQVDVRFQGATYPAGKPLVALQQGFGLIRQTPQFRRMLAIGQLILEPADPVNYAPLFHLRPVDYADVGETATPGANLLDVPTVGDMNVPVNTGIAIAKAAGILGVMEPDPRYGKPQVDVLIGKYVLEGLWRLQRFGRPQQFDCDDLSGGKKTWPATEPPDFPPLLRLAPPLRATVPGIGNGKSAMRIPYVSAKGAHGFSIPSPEAEFDIDTYMAYLIAEYFRTGGEHVPDDPCLATAKPSCPFFPQ